MHRILLALVLGLSLLLRLGYLMETQSSFLAHTEEWSDTDMHFFCAWAEQIAEGDYFSLASLHPYHSWHEMVGTREEWVQWYGEKTLHQAPFYPYLLSLLWHGLAMGKWGIWGGQILLGLLTILGVHEIGRRCFSPSIGLLAALLQGVSASAIFYESLVLRSTLLSFLHVAILLLGAAVLEAPRKGRTRAFLALSLGGFLGLLVLTRPNGVLLFFLVGLAVLGWNRARLRLAVYQASCLLVGLILILLPVVVRNASVGAPLFSISSVGAVTFTMGNASDVSGLRLEVSRETRRILTETDGELLPTVVATLKTHQEDPLGILSQVSRKLLGFFHGFEAPDNGSMELARRSSLVVRWMTFPFGLLCPLALVGILLFFTRQLKPRDGSEGRALILLMFLTLASLLLTALLFYPSSRFRVPVLPVFCLFASGGFGVVLRWVREKKWKATAGILGLLTMLVVGLNLPYEFTTGGLRRDDLVSAWAYYKDRGEFEEGQAYLRKLAKKDPDERVILSVRAQAAFDTGQSASCKELCRQLIQLDPVDPFPYLWQSLLCQREGDLNMALEWGKSGLARLPHHAGLNRQAARVYRLLGNEKSAEVHEDRAR